MTCRVFRCGLLVLALLIWRSTAHAQIDPVELTVDRANVGLGGVARAGDWVPAKMVLRNNTASPRAVVCQWEMDDPDGDVVRMKRTATLSPGRSQDVWIYAHPALNAKLEQPWRFTVFDKENGAVLARASAATGGTLSAHVRAIGVSGAIPRGLEVLRTDGDGHSGGSGIGGMNYGLVTQHEANHYLTSLRPQMLPDRWFGMMTLQAYIWTPEEGGDPGSPTISPDTIKALREWVRRGGHLVVILPAAEDWWTQSPLADMLPGIELASRGDARIPSWLGFVPLGDDGKQRRIDLKQIKLKDGAEKKLAVLCRDELGVPLAVAGRYGFGRVTLIGVDITSPAIVKLGLPSGRRGIWNDVFNWRCDALSWKYLEDQAKEGTVYRPSARSVSELNGEQIDSVIDMHDTVGALLLGASILFAVYWGLACPGSWYLLRRAGLERHSWLVFTGIACVFVLIAWVGALFARPGDARISHYSVIDLDAKTGQARIHSWATVFVPAHGLVKLDVETGDPSAAANGPSGTICAVGSMAEGQGTTFLESQVYGADAGSPAAMEVPFRSTAKRVSIDWRGSVDSLEWRAATTAPASSSTRRGISGTLTQRGDFVEGTLTHDLPGALEDVRVVFPSETGEPWVTAVSTWRAGQPLDLKAVTTATNPGGAMLRQRLAIRPPNSDDLWAGYLGDLLRLPPGTTRDPVTGQKTQLSTSALAQSAELLTYFDNLPPPRSISAKPISVFNFGEERSVERGPGRVLEMSHVLGLKRIIITGHLNRSPMIAPLHIDGKTIAGTGWTFVRWVGELEAAPAMPTTAPNLEKGLEKGTSR